MNKSGIYKIQSTTKPRRCYIGSAINIKKRWWHHLSELRLNKHANNLLQGHYNKYGESDLQFSVLICCEKEALIKHEQFFIDSLNPSFNICRKAQSLSGFKHSKEAIKKQSERMKGKKYHLGFKHSKETKLKMSADRKGRHMSPEAVEKLRLRMIGNTYTKGYKASQETKNKISVAKKGKQYRLGTKANENTRKQMSETHREIWRKRKLIS